MFGWVILPAKYGKALILSRWHLYFMMQDSPSCKGPLSPQIACDKLSGEISGGKVGRKAKLA